MPDTIFLPPVASPTTEPLALYIHWPFCVSKCPYCDFNSHVREGIDVDAWRGALLADMAHEAALTGGRPLTSIFFGGGTPSLMPPALVADLIAAADRQWGLAPDSEITLEANPNSVEAIWPRRALTGYRWVCRRWTMMRCISWGARMM